MHSPQIYEDEIDRYCRYKGLKLDLIYKDLDYSAFRGARPRPSLEELVKERKSYAAVIILKLSRFGRSVKDLVRLFELFDSDGIPLVFLDMNLDTSTSQGRLLRHILAAFAEYESDVKADYTRANHRRARAEGRAWGTTPFGYERGEQPGTWVVDESGATTIRRIFEMYRQGASANAVARALNSEGLLTCRGTRWIGAKVGKLLDNPSYAGLSIIDDSFVEAQWPAIVDRETWDAVRARRQTDPHRRALLGKRRPVSPYLLSGLLWCDQCGRKMHHTTTTRDKRGLYVCDGPDWGEWTGCRNARLYGQLADAEIAERFLERCAFTIVNESGTLAGSPRELWAQASLRQRQHLLALVIERIDAVPRAEYIPRSQWRTRLRHHLRIEWRKDVATHDDIVVIADSPAEPEHKEVSDARHEMMRKAEVAAVTAKSRKRSETAERYYAEWRAARNLPEVGKAIQDVGLEVAPGSDIARLTESERI